jgi:hypothetical protein
MEPTNPTNVNNPVDRDSGSGYTEFRFNVDPKTLGMVMEPAPTMVVGMNIQTGQAVGVGPDGRFYPVSASAPLVKRTLSDYFFLVLRSMEDTHERKNSDYTGDDSDPLANFKVALEMGCEPWLGAAVRCSDKWERIKGLLKKANGNFAGGNSVVGESLKDTVIDMANYLLIIQLCILDAETGPQNIQREAGGRNGHPEFYRLTSQIRLLFVDSNTKIEYFNALEGAGLAGWLNVLGDVGVCWKGIKAEILRAMDDEDVPDIYDDIINCSLLLVCAYVLIEEQERKHESSVPKQNSSV